MYRTVGYSQEQERSSGSVSSLLFQHSEPDMPESGNSCGMVVVWSRKRHARTVLASTESRRTEPVNEPVGDPFFNGRPSAGLDGEALRGGCLILQRSKSQTSGAFGVSEGSRVYRCLTKDLPHLREVK